MTDDYLLGVYKAQDKTVLQTATRGAQTFSTLHLSYASQLVTASPSSLLYIELIRNVDTERVRGKFFSLWSRVSASYVHVIASLDHVISLPPAADPNREN